MYRRIRSPKQRFIRTFVSRQYFRLKEKEEGFPKGGTLVHLFGSVRSTHCRDCRLRKNKPDTKKAYYKRSAATTTIIHYSFFTIHFFRPPLTPCRRHALHRTSGSSGQTRHIMSIPTTFNITYRRATKVSAPATERV